MELAENDPKRRSFSNSFLKKKRDSKKYFPRKIVQELIQRPRSAQKSNKSQEIVKLRQKKQTKIMDKRRKREQQRQIQRKIRSLEEQVHLPTCQALNRLERRCKSKVLDQSDFCKIHQFYDSEASGLVQCLGRNKRLKRCIKSVPADEKYCKYHKNQNK